MAKFIKIPISENRHQWQFMCPACKYTHAISEEIHSFNQDVNSPSLSPSILCRSKDYCCHSFIKDGMIQFLNDCTHSLAGQTVELPEIENN